MSFGKGRYPSRYIGSFVTTTRRDPFALAPHGQRASTLMVQVVTVCEPPELASRLPEPQPAPGAPAFADPHDPPSAVTAQFVLQPWAATTAMEVASFGASTHPAGSCR